MIKTVSGNRFDWSKILRIIIKTVVLFLVFNLLFAWFDPIHVLGELSVYNTFIPGRVRLPYGDDPQRSYNLTVTQLEAMIASHEFRGAHESPDEFRILILGDSSVWGFLLPHDETLAAKITAGDYRTADGGRVRAYNFGYPTMSLLKDLVLLERALDFNPDFIVWLFTLESFPREKQIESPLVQYNPEQARALIERYHLDLDPLDARFTTSSFWERTIVGRRKMLADLFRLQLYGVLWASSTVDRHIPETYNRLMEDLSADQTFHGHLPGDLAREDLAFDVLSGGIQAAGDIPVLLVNEPVFISEGENSDIRYNFYYPRWAYDAYRRWMKELCLEFGWDYMDLWDLLSANSFTDSAIHYDSQAADTLAQTIATAVLERVDGSPVECGD
ncbi:MAG: hypothetical protein GTO14_02920 [Anaerolineales bacterium]|nr:hypothetical protein [Anaerolineales bacterium]